MEKHTFSKDRYEMSRDEGERLIAILSDIAGEQTDDLISAFQTLQKMQSEMDKAHACLIECKKQFVQVQNVLNLIITKLKSLSKYGTKSI